MTTSEITALETLLKKANLLRTTIESADRNILTYANIFEGQEIKIQNNDNTGNPIYIAGKSKDRICEVLVEQQQAFKAIQVAKLEALQLP